MIGFSGSWEGGASIHPPSPLLSLFWQSRQNVPGGSPSHRQIEKVHKDPLKTIIELYTWEGTIFSTMFCWKYFDIALGKEGPNRNFFWYRKEEGRKRLGEKRKNGGQISGIGRVNSPNKSKTNILHKNAFFLSLKKTLKRSILWKCLKVAPISILSLPHFPQGSIRDSVYPLFDHRQKCSTEPPRYIWIYGRRGGGGGGGFNVSGERERPPADDEF